MEEEIQHLIQAFDYYELHELANQKVYDGFIAETAVSVVQSGIGKVNASIASALLIEKFKVEIVVNTGSAGAVKSGLKIGDLVLATELAYHDVDNRIFNYQYGQIPQMPARYKSDEQLIKEIEVLSVDKLKVHRGLIVSGDSFVSTKKETDRIQEYFPNALVTEMEGAAVAQTCHQFDIPFIVIRSVSDTADESADMDFDEFVQFAGKRSAELVISFIKNK